MNKIYKVVWNKVKNCYVVGSEFISSHSRGAVITLGCPKNVLRHLVVAALLCSVGVTGSMTAWAEGNENKGENNTVDGDWNTAWGTGNKAQGQYNTVWGQENNAGGIGSTAFGSKNNAQGYDSTTIGQGNVAHGQGALAIGQGSTANGDNTFAGLGGTAYGRNSFAVGQGAMTGSDNTYAIGAGSQSLVSGSVALGDNSVASRDKGFTGYLGNGKYDSTWVSTGGVIAVGGPSVTRQITGVAAGTEDTDAVNVAQLKEVIDLFKNDGTGDGAHTTVVAKDSNVSVQKGENVAGGKEYTVGIADTITLKDSTDPASKDSVTINGPEGNVTATGTVRGGKSAISDDGVAYDGKTYINANGLNANSNKVINVKDGDVNETSKDAVNGSQLHQRDLNIKKNATEIKNIQKQLWKPTVEGSTDTVEPQDHKIDFAGAKKDITDKDGNVTTKDHQNIKVASAEAGKITFDLADDLQLKNVTADKIDATTVNAGNMYVTNVDPDKGDSVINKDYFEKNSLHIAPTETGKEYEVDDKGNVTMTYVDGAGNKVADKQAVIKGVAKNDLSNLTKDGDKYINTIAKESVKVLAGDNVDVKAGTQDGVSGPINTYTVSVQANGQVAGGNTGIVTGDTVYNAIEKVSWKVLVNGTEAKTVAKDGTLNLTDGDHISIISNDNGDIKISATGFADEKDLITGGSISDKGEISLTKKNGTDVKLTGAVHDYALSGAELSEDGTLTLSTQDQYGGAAGISYTVKGIAKNDLSNITEGGRTIITNLAKGVEQHIAPTKDGQSYGVDKDGNVTLTYVDGNGNAVADQKVVISGVAKNDLSNITDGGKNVVTELAQKAVQVVDGTNTKVTETTTDGVRKYAVNVEASGAVKDGDTKIVTGDTVYKALQESGWNLTADGQNKTAVKKDNTVDISGKKETATDGKDYQNITVTKGVDDNNVTVALSKELKGLDSVTAGTMYVTNVGNGDNAVVNKKYLTDHDDYVTSGKLSSDGKTITLNRKQGGTVDVDLSGLGGAISTTDFRLVNGTDTIKEATNNSAEVKGYKVKDDGTVELSVQNGTDEATKQTVTIGDVASKKQQDTNTQNITRIDGAVTNLDTRVTNLQDAAKGGGFGLKDQEGKEVRQNIGTSITVVGANGIETKVVDGADNTKQFQIGLGNSITLGEKGADGKDGVDGHIGLNGKDGQSADIIVKTGDPGLDGKDGITRIVYTDEKGNEQQVATKNDGLKFVGDDGQEISKKLNETLGLKGGADAAKLTDKNIGVVKGDDGSLNVKLSKDIDLTENGSVKIGDTSITNNKVTVGGDHKITLDGSKGTVNDLTNKTWDKDNITSGQAATEDQLKDVQDALNEQDKGNVKYATKEENGKTVIDYNTVVMGNGQGTAYDKDAKTGGTTITNVSYVTADKTDPNYKGDAAVNVDRLNDSISNITIELTNKGLTFKGNTDATVKKKLGETMNIVGEGTKDDANYSGENVKTMVENGNLVVKLDKDLKGNSVTVGEKGVNGKDGADGQLSIVNKDGTNTTITITKGGKPGVDGKDDETTTRVVYTDANGNGQQVANLNDGLKFVGDAGNIIGKKLNETLTIKGGVTDESKLTDGNIGVISKDGVLNVKLAKNLDLGKDGSVTMGNTSINNGGLTVKGSTVDGMTYTDITINQGNVSMGGNVIHNVSKGVEDSDAVNVGQMKEAISAGNTDTHIDTSKQYAVGTDGSIHLTEVDKDGKATGKEVVIKDVAKSSDVGSVDSFKDDLKNKDADGKPTHTTVVDAVNNLNNKVGGLDYTAVDENGNKKYTGDVKDGDSTTVAIGKLNNKLGDIADTAGKHSSVSAGNGITVDGTKKNADGGIDYKVSLGNTITLGDKDSKHVTVDGTNGNVTATGTVSGSDFKAGDVTINKGGDGYVEGLKNTSWDSKLTDKDAKDGGYKGSTKAATESQLQQAMAGTVQYDRDDKGNVTNKITLNTTKNGDKVTYTTITNVADGKVDKDSKDAVNGSQLWATNQQVNQNTTNIQNIAGNLGKLDSRVNKVGAGAAALAALHPLDFDPDAKWDFSAGYGHYQGASAVAIGTYYRPNEDTMFSIGGSCGSGENMVNAGVSLKIGTGENHVSTSRVAMAKEIKDLRKELEDLKSALLDAQAHKPIDTSKLQLFPDVPQNHWAYEYVAVLAGNGIIEGYPSGNFDGSRPMTRYEFAAMLYRAMLKGAKLSDKILTEFAPELECFTVDTVAKDKDGNPTIERVRVKKPVENK